MSPSFAERVLHSVLYEVIALIITGVFTFALLDRPLLLVGSLALSLSLLAMLWNFIFNYIFDFYFPLTQPRTANIRILHAIGFEGGMLIFAIPITVIIMDISFIAALIMDSGFFIFYFCYTDLFNLIWDKIRNYR